MKNSIGVFLVLVAFETPLVAEEYTDQLITIDIPEGFEGPIQESPGPNAKVVGYTKPYQDRDGGTLLQITEYDMGESLRGMPEDARGETADYYLLQFLSGVERRRTNFVAAQPERIMLGGIPGARAKWTGDFAGQQTSGVMYCVVIGTVVVSFHTQDLDGAPQENRAAATKAFEGVRTGG
jgi:hypothetical protein